MMVPTGHISRYKQELNTVVMFVTTSKSKGSWVPHIVVFVVVIGWFA